MDEARANLWDALAQVELGGTNNSHAVLAPLGLKVSSLDIPGPGSIVSSWLDRSKPWFPKRCSCLRINA